MLVHDCSQAYAGSVSVLALLRACRALGFYCAIRSCQPRPLMASSSCSALTMGVITLHCTPLWVSHSALTIWGSLPLIAPLCGSATLPSPCGSSRSIAPACRLPPVLPVARAWPQRSPIAHILTVAVPDPCPSCYKAHILTVAVPDPCPSYHKAHILTVAVPDPCPSYHKAHILTVAVPDPCPSCHKAHILTMAVPDPCPSCHKAHILTVAVPAGARHRPALCVTQNQRVCVHQRGRGGTAEHAGTWAHEAGCTRRARPACGSMPCTPRHFGPAGNRVWVQASGSEGVEPF